MRYHFILTRMAIIKKTDNHNCGPGFGETGTLHMGGDIVKGAGHFGK